MKVLLVGSGGREHVLAWKISQSPKLTKLFIAPGNAGMVGLGECVDIKAEDIPSLLAFAKDHQIDLTVVGPEAPLVAGIVDQFEAEGLRIFGPNQKAAQLEGSKIFAKELMAEANVPTAAFKIFSDVNEAKTHIIEQEPPIVIKADGLAAGKGVILAESAEDGIKAVNQMISERMFGEAGSRVVIEEHLNGSELSVLILTDGKSVLPLASSQDHKRAYDNDRGPNTGGMGAYSPCPLINTQKLTEVVKTTGETIIHKLREKGIVYRGVLYVGLMLTEKGPRVLEYNVRFGDPEAQAVLPRLKTDLLDILDQIARGQLTTQTLEWDERACITIVMASGGYPGSYQKGFTISGLEAASQTKDTVVFHAGTVLTANQQIQTNGGRVLAVSALGETLKVARDLAYQEIQKISFNHAFYRGDIANRALTDDVSIKK